MSNGVATASTRATSRKYSVKDPAGEAQLDLMGAVPFLLMHAGCILVFWTGVSRTAVFAAFVLLVVRVFGLTGGYHRYFSHHTYKTGRVFQIVLGWLGAMAVQMGPLWWAAHHRHHHRFADTEFDIHSPKIKNFIWAHMGWVMSNKYYQPVNYDLVPEFRKFPELMWLDRNPLIPPAVLLLALAGTGWWMESVHPQLGTGPLQMVAWGFFVSTVVLYHVTFLVNSAAHVFGKRVFDTPDESRNNWWVALLTMGEGWHNNHHRFPGSERQGFVWWQIDMTHYILTVLSWFGIVWGLQKPPKSVLAEMKK